MPRKTKTTAAADKAAQPQFQIPAELLDHLVTGPMTQGQVLGLFDQLKKALVERCLGAEMSHHLGYAPGDLKPAGAGANHRNGKSAKTVLTDAGALPSSVLTTTFSLVTFLYPDFSKTNLYVPGFNSSKP